MAQARLATGELDAQRRAALSELRQSVIKLRELGTTMAQMRRGNGHSAEQGDGAKGNAGAGALEIAERYGLSLRELEVALLISEGFSNREIATAVRVSTHTARHHTQHVLAKLGVRSRSRAAALINDLLTTEHLGR